MSTAVDRRSPWAVTGLVVGVLALVTAQAHFWLGPLEPPPSAGEQIADGIAEIREGLQAGLRGEPLAEREEETVGPDALLRGSTSIAAGLAMLVGLLGFVRREDRRLALGAMALGGLTLLWSMALLAAAIVIVVAIVACGVAVLGGS